MFELNWRIRDFLYLLLLVCVKRLVTLPLQKKKEKQRGKSAYNYSRHKKKGRDKIKASIHKFETLFEISISRVRKVDVYNATRPTRRVISYIIIFSLNFRHHNNFVYNVDGSRVHHIRFPRRKFCLKWSLAFGTVNQHFGVGGGGYANFSLIKQQQMKRQKRDNHAIKLVRILVLFTSEFGYTRRVYT